MDHIVQGTPEWHAIRLGKVTASRIADVVGRAKTGYGAGRRNYMAELVVERLTGTRTEGFTNAAMQWGTDMEPDARAAYQFHINTRVEQIGFVPHQSIADTGASPDGYVGADGMVEIKCPNTATHLETLLGGPVAEKYYLQMQWQMACAGRAWCDFASYDPRLPDVMALHVLRIPRDDARIAELETEVVSFLTELRDTVHLLRAKFGLTEPEPEAALLMMAG